MKRKLLRILLIIVVVIFAAIGGLLAYVKTALPKVGDAPEMKIEITPERIERGSYLANHVMICMDCHSTRDWTLFSGPPVPGTEGKGGEKFDQSMDFPGTYVAANITPANLKEWTDGEIFRAITAGVSKDGRPLFPIMPHPNFGQLDEEDIKSVIAYIRSLPAIENETEASTSDFPMNFIIHTIPKAAQLAPMPDKSDKVAYGKYLVTAASCFNCHTNEIKGEIVGEPFAGGREFKFPDGSILRSSNITPHATGIGNWSEDVFTLKFRQYADTSYQYQKVEPGQFQTLMPWTMYGKMTEEDIRAVYAYLKTVEPVENTVERYTAAE